MKETIMLTGATGFIGGFIVEEAIHKGMEVHCIVRKSSDISRINLPGVYFHQFTPDDPERLHQQFQAFSGQYGQPDYFVHNAGITKTLDSTLFNQINAVHTLNYARAVVGNFPKIKRFVLMSSLAAQGPGNAKTLQPIEVSHPAIPDTLYGKSKLAAENHLKSVEGLPYTILRPTGVYGPYDRDYLLYLKALQAGIEPVMGFKEQHLSFVFVTDLIGALFLTLEKQVQGQTFLVSDGNNYTGSQYGLLAREALQTRALRLNIPLPLVNATATVLQQIGKITGHTPTLNKDKYLTMKALNWKVNIENTRVALGFTPAVDLKEGLRLCVEWYRRERWLH